MMLSKVVLIIDDDPGVARLCQQVLERVGFDVVCMTNPQQGVTVLQQARVDLLLVDIRMPKIDGFQVMEIARTHQPDIAIVVMTGFGTVETAVQALRLGANGLILKPFSETSELVDSVRQALKKKEHKREMARLQAMQPLIQVTQSLFAETRPEVLIDLILDAVCGHLHCEHAGFYREDGDNFLKLVASRGKPLPGEISSLEGGPVSRADAWGASIQVNADGSEHADLQRVLTERNLGSVICAPAQRNQEDRSVLLAGRSKGKSVFSEADLEMFTILARQAAVALENARLYAELRDYVHQIEESQRKLIQAEKMAAIGRLAASIAHEVNNPLQAVRNCLHLIDRQDLAIEKREKFLWLAKDELERLMDTIRQMLDFYRPSALDRVETNVNALVEVVLSLLEKQLQKDNVEVETQFAPELPNVLAVSNQIQQVFFNIVLNAMEAMPNGGKIFIETHKNENHIEILFKDTGPGVPEDQQTHIFEPFISTKKHGTGLGLSVSYSIVDAHGGKLELLNERDCKRKGGACFRVALPYLEAK
ncbi:MAG: response regulator [Anaerolineales bacterium]